MKSIAQFLQLLLMLEVVALISSIERIPNPTITNVPFFTKLRVFLKSNATYWYQNFYQPMTSNPQWIYASFMKEFLEKQNGTLNLSGQCAADVLTIIDDFPAMYTIQCKCT